MSRISIAAMLCASMLLSAPSTSCAVEPDEVLADSALEARARKLSVELRCLVCQNQSIDDSNAPLARDLRLLVRERLKKGDTDQEVLSFVVARYGEFVLLRPPFGWHTLLLWLAPLFVLGIAFWLAFGVARRGIGRSTEAGPAVGLSAEEEEQLSKILNDQQETRK